MKSSRIISIVFGILGAVAAVLTLWLSLSSRNAAPMMLRRPEEAGACARQMLDAVCAGDYSSAGACFYGSPRMQSGAETESESGRLIWAAFVDSLEYELVGESYVSEQGISQKVKLHRLDFASVTEKLPERSQTLLTKRVEEATDITQVYSSGTNYQEDFVLGVLRDATLDALREDSRYVDEEIVLNMIFDQGRWWVLADQALMNAISGGVV